MADRISAYPATSRSRADSNLRASAFADERLFVIVVVVVSSQRDQLGTAGWSSIDR